MAYLKTLRGRPEVGSVLKPVRGSDSEVLARGEALHTEHCGSCHPGKAPDLKALYRRGEMANGEPVKEPAVLTRIRSGHANAPPNESLEEAALFALINYLKAHAPQ